MTINIYLKIYSLVYYSVKYYTLNYFFLIIYPKESPFFFSLLVYSYNKLVKTIHCAFCCMGRNELQVENRMVYLRQHGCKGLNGNGKRRNEDYIFLKNK